MLTSTARGKTSPDVAGILNLTKRTVDEYSLRASRKSPARYKTQAQVKALPHSLISL